MKAGILTVIWVLLPIVCLDKAIAAPDLNVGGCSPIHWYTKQSFEPNIRACDSLIHGFGWNGSNSEHRAIGFYYRGLLYHQQGNYQQAIADYTAAMSWKTNYEDALEARGDAYEDLGQHEKAASDYAQAALIQADGPDSLAARCWVRTMRGHPLDRALADCNSALKLGADDPDISEDFCFLYFRLGRYSNAIADCTKLVARNHRDADALYLNGLAKLRSGDTAGGNADVAAAHDADYQIVDQYAAWGVTR